MPDEGTFAERPHDDHRDAELGGERQQLRFHLALMRVVRQLHNVETTRAQRPCHLVEDAG
jgi:hypothetical protein